ncbi:CACTA en-spm transposon protein [Cucumis melo var. makuwa]|uniref:CACTA en-spm transposon protein n=1 Tax=Cucumis melo var. makuwa TaxID=1194695 RepID=A0A5A7SLP6_CUCMM|nr:CACTA en-spm transposon protein [Cucumis melo var. makuwa]TYK30759.1 CACTA en-spm transposon protein [Cucumis melo var. makuwa]
MKFKRYVQKNRKIPISIAPGAEKRISPHAVQFSNTIGVSIRDRFPVCYLKWANILSEYIEVVKGSLQEQSRTNKTAREKQPYNHSSRSKSFLQQHELSEE